MESERNHIVALDTSREEGALVGYSEQVRRQGPCGVFARVAHTMDVARGKPDAAESQATAEGSIPSTKWQRFLLWRGINPQSWPVPSWRKVRRAPRLFYVLDTVAVSGAEIIRLRAKAGRAAVQGRKEGWCVR